METLFTSFPTPANLYLNTTSTTFCADTLIGELYEMVRASANQTNSNSKTQTANNMLELVAEHGHLLCNPLSEDSGAIPVKLQEALGIILLCQNGNGCFTDDDIISLISNLKKKAQSLELETGLDYARTTDRATLLDSGIQLILQKTGKLCVVRKEEYEFDFDPNVCPILNELEPCVNKYRKSGDLSESDAYQLHQNTVNLLKHPYIQEGLDGQRFSMAEVKVIKYWNVDAINEPVVQKYINNRKLSLKVGCALHMDVIIVLRNPSIQRSIDSGEQDINELFYTDHYGTEYYLTAKFYSSPVDVIQVWINTEKIPVEIARGLSVTQVDILKDKRVLEYIAQHKNGVRYAVQFTCILEPMDVKSRPISQLDLENLLKLYHLGVLSRLFSLLKAANILMHGLSLIDELTKYYTNTEISIRLKQLNKPHLIKYFTDNPHNFLVFACAQPSTNLDALETPGVQKYVDKNMLTVDYAIHNLSQKGIEELNNPNTQKLIDKCGFISTLGLQSWRRDGQHSMDLARKRSDTDVTNGFTEDTLADDRPNKKAKTL